MASTKHIVIWVGILISAAAIIVVGTKLIPLAEQGPGYKAKNLALTMDVVSNAPEKTRVEYNIKKDVSFAAFEYEGNKARVARFDMCKYTQQYAINYGEGTIRKTISKINPFAVAEPTITGAGILEDHSKAISEQMESYKYRKIKSCKYTFDGTSNKKNIEYCTENYIKTSAGLFINNPTLAEGCNKLLTCFHDYPFYNEPETIIIENKNGEIIVNEKDN